MVRGNAERPRVSVYRSSSRMIAQLIDDTAGVTLVGLTTEAKGKQSKTEQAAELGKRMAEAVKKQKKAGIVFDRGGYRYHGRVKAVAEAMREAGLDF